MKFLLIELDMAKKQLIKIILATLMHLEKNKPCQMIGIYAQKCVTISLKICRSLPLFWKQTESSRRSRDDEV